MAGSLHLVKECREVANVFLPATRGRQAITHPREQSCGRVSFATARQEPREKRRNFLVGRQVVGHPDEGGVLDADDSRGLVDGRKIAEI